MTKTDFVNWAVSKGWQKDKYGHLQRSSGGKEYRYKLSPHSVRYETRIHFESQYGGKQNEWVRLRSGYFKDLSFNNIGQLSGLKY